VTQPDRDVNSVDEIVVDRDPAVHPAVLEAVIHDIRLHSDVLFTWDYERSRSALVKLHEKAKTSQWKATTDGWLGTKFTELGIIQFDDWTDSSEEYAELDAVATNRALAVRGQAGGS
jgi:hypothetical protein